MIRSDPHAVPLFNTAEHIGVVFDDGNAEQSVEAVLADTLYEDKIRVLNVWDVGGTRQGEGELLVVKAYCDS